MKKEEMTNQPCKAAKGKDVEYVYLLTNAYMPGLVKIGRTSRCEVKARIDELYNTSVPVPFECRYACEVPTNKSKEIESAIHIALADKRVNEKREFFQIDYRQLLPLMKVLSEKAKDATQVINDEIDNDLDQSDKEALAKSRKKRPSLNYEEMGIPKGAVLIYKNDPSVSVEIAGPRRILYKGEEMSLTKVTSQLLQSEYSVQPTPYWTYEGKELMDIYNETYTIEEDE